MISNKNKKNNMKNLAWHILTRGGNLLLFALLLFGCSEDPIEWKVKSTDQVITQYVESNPDFSGFADLLERTGLNSLLAVRGPFTLFLPSNTAMQAYYTEKGVKSHLDFTDEFAGQLVRNHIIPSQIETGDIGLGALRDVNALGDYLVTEFAGADIILNKKSKIVKRNIQASNGVIHLIDKVIDPVTRSVYDVLAQNPSFSLFTEGLKRTNLKDTLQIIDFPFGKKTARTRFTILAVADSTFKRYGINNINQLISYFTKAPDSITFLNNGFYRYMEYHCLAETHYLNDLETRLYPILSYDNNISITVDDDYKLNLNTLTKKYTGFVIEESNYTAKNGSVHTIKDLLPVYEPQPTVFTWETTDQFDLKQGDYFDKYYMRWFDGQNTFANIKWEGDYMLYYFKDHDTGKLLNDDCLSMSGWWWVEVKTPKIMKGNYKLTSNLWSGQIDYSVYVDGVNTAMIKRSDPAEATSWGEFHWIKTETHKVKVVATSPGLLFWDTLIFTPVN
jgi:uncharacterized surface protein with fasciclin (FAS1) repeats